MLFRILGSLEVEHGGRLLDLGRPKQRALLASLLASANQVVSADRLLDELWGDDPPNDPGQALHVQVSRLCKVLAPAESQRLGAVRWLTSTARSWTPRIHQIR